MCSLIYFALPILLFIAPFTHVSPRPPRRRRGPIYRTVPTNTHQMALRFSTIGVAIRNISYIKTDRKKREATP